MSKGFLNLIVILIILSYWVTAAVDDLRLAVPFLVGSSALATIALAVIWYLGEKGGLDWSPRFIIAVAVLIRLPFLFSAPQLSDDIYRYLWDGLQMLGGANPYAHPPASVPAVSASLATLRSLVNHPDLVTIYPPTAQLVFAAGAALGGSVLGMKLLLVLCDLLFCLLMLALLKRWNMPRWRATLYAWGPLPVLEIAGSGHVDGVGILFLFMAVALLEVAFPVPTASAAPARRGEDGLGPGAAAGCGALLACASLIKLFPLVYVPAFLLAVPSRRRTAFAAGFLVTGAVLLLPFQSGLPHMFQTLRTYAHDWEFAGFLFNLLREVTGSGLTARLLLAGTFLALAAFSTRRLAAALSIPRSHAAPSGMRSAPGSMAQPSAGPALAEHGYRVTLCFLFLTPTLQPWYALYLVAFLPFAAGPAGFVFCWSVLLSYRVLIPYAVLGRWQESGWVNFLVFLAPAAAAGMAALARRRGETRAAAS